MLYSMPYILNFMHRQLGTEAYVKCIYYDHDFRGSFIELCYPNK